MFHLWWPSRGLPSNPSPRLCYHGELLHPCLNTVTTCRLTLGAVSSFALLASAKLLSHGQQLIHLQMSQLLGQTVAIVFRIGNVDPLKVCFAQSYHNVIQFSRVGRAISQLAIGEQNACTM